MTAFQALADTLRRLADAIRPLTVDEFAARDLRSSGSIGAHVRHCLDHVAALEQAIVTGELSYDRRQRNTVVERDPELARSRLMRASARAGGFAAALVHRPLRAVMQIGDDGASIATTTTVGREVAFVISHTVHHSAMIAVLLEQSNHDVPYRLGVAPTTPAAACAR